MKIKFTQLTSVTTEIAQAFNKWDNDPELKHLIRPCRNQADIDLHIPVTVDLLIKRLESSFIYLIYLEDQLIGEMSFQINFDHLYKKEQATAWIGIVIGEACGRNKRIGSKALLYIEKQIRLQNLKRIELGVFLFNTAAHKLYNNSGYQEIGRIKEFTYWQGKMWSDVRMEKYLK